MLFHKIIEKINVSEHYWIFNLICYIIKKQIQNKYLNEIINLITNSD